MTKKNRIHLKLGQVCIGVKSPKCRRIPMSPNQLNTRHWGERSSWKEAWEEEVAWAWLADKDRYAEQYKMMPYKKAKLEIFIFSIKPQDQDNAYASMKGVIDGLVKINLIEDDSPDKLRVKITNIPVDKKIAEHIELSLEKVS